MMWKGFTRHLLGARYEKAVKSGLTSLFVFWGLRQAEISVPIAPIVLCLMTFTVTYGSMWQDLAAKNEALAGKNLFMLPSPAGKWTAAYVGALGLYTFLMRTIPVLAPALAVSSLGGTEIFFSFLSALSGVVLAAWAYGDRKRRKRIFLWVSGTIFLSVSFRSVWIFLAGMALNSGVAIVFLKKLDPYGFYEESKGALKAEKHRSAKGFLLWTYFLRYLWQHKHYLVNTGILWGIAAILPLCLGEIEGSLALPIGYALLTLNTPVCILLSGDPGLEQAVRMLPGQRRCFLLPYGLFLVLCNLVGDLIFFLSFCLQGSRGSVRDLGSALLFAVLGAFGSIGMEWYFPIRGWKTQSELWHHPRKYIVPGSLLLLAGLLAIWL